MTTTIRPEELPELGIANDEESPFLLSGAEWYTLQRYVNDALTLPVSEQALRRDLGMLDGESLETFHKTLAKYGGSVEILRELIAGYGSINQNCRTWRDVTFPQSVNLADSIVHYSRKVPTYYGALADVLKGLRGKTGPDAEALRADARDILDELAADARMYADQAATVREAIIAFAQATKQDKTTITDVHDRMAAQMGNFSGRVKELNDSIDQLRKEIDKLNKDYEHSVVVAATSPTYAWVLPFGLIAAAIVAGVYGDAAAKLMKRINEAKAKLEQQNEELQIKVRLGTLMGLADNRLDGLIALIGPALEVIQKIEGIWRALASDLESVNTVIDSIETGLDERARLLHLRVTTAITQWQALGKQANDYRVNAFIDVPPPTKAAAS
ncbi:MAG: hypothetical protein OHK0022_12680 [Roseiflexaceae bacterium]